MAKAKAKKTKRAKPTKRTTRAIGKAKRTKARRDKAARVERPTKEPADPVCRHCGQPKSKHETRFERCPHTGSTTLTRFEKAEPGSVAAQEPERPAEEVPSGTPGAVQDAAGGVEASGQADDGRTADAADAGEECPVCGGVGQVCQTCGNADGECTCPAEDGPDVVPCPECGGARSDSFA